MIEIRKPGLLADTIEIDLVRFRQAGVLVAMPAGMTELANALERVSAMLREADERGQAVDVADDVMRLIQQFRGALRAVGGAPAEA